MFKSNNHHLQPLLISNINDLSERHLKRLRNSWAYIFYIEFFRRLKEEPCAVLFADHPSRPNVPANWLITIGA
ncbi:MAG: hypothetical protein A2Z14_18070 [Chloroflexi bacterium RBG_16_48_8]|nr:MAG: hypothetical protein A2Z14_18070 [Chloroflexi bacterium RBG_16_48_8]